MAAKATTAKRQANKGNKSNKASKATPTGYADIVSAVSLPVDERPKLAIGRKGERVVPRRFHLAPEQLDKLRAERKENPKAIPNPHNLGAYWLFVEALKSLGPDKTHKFANVKSAMRKLGSTAENKDDEGITLWDRFANKEAKGATEDTCLDVDGRIKQNAYVLQRLGGFTPYGLKLLQTGQLVLKTKGMVIDILRDKDGKGICFRLNTNSAEPVNESLKRAAK